MSPSKYDPQDCVQRLDAIPDWIWIMTQHADEVRPMFSFQEGHRVESELTRQANTAVSIHARGG